MWTIFQFSIFFAVIASDIQYQWAAGPLVAPFFGFTIAYAATCILAWAIDLFRKPGVRPQPLSPHIGYSAQQPSYKRLR
jgi:hypothetical protein